MTIAVDMGRKATKTNKQTQIITKAYQATKFDQILQIFTIQYVTFSSEPKARGVHNVKHFNCIMWYAPHLLQIFLNIVSPYRRKGCVNEQDICMNCAIYSILINFIIYHVSFQEKQQQIEPRHEISDNLTFWQVQTQTSLCSLLLSLETPNSVQSVA